MKATVAGPKDNVCRPGCAVFASKPTPARFPVRIFMRPAPPVDAATALPYRNQAQTPKCETGVTAWTIRRPEIDGTIDISPKLRHGHVSKATFDKIARALARRGVELVPEGTDHGAGVSGSGRGVSGSPHQRGNPWAALEGRE